MTRLKKRKDVRRPCKVEDSWVEVRDFEKVVYVQSEIFQNFTSRMVCRKGIPSISGKVRWEGARRNGVRVEDQRR